MKKSALVESSGNYSFDFDPKRSPSPHQHSVSRHRYVSEDDYIRWNRVDVTNHLLRAQIAQLEADNTTLRDAFRILISKQQQRTTTNTTGSSGVVGSTVGSRGRVLDSGKLCTRCAATPLSSSPRSVTAASTQTVTPPPARERGGERRLSRSGAPRVPKVLVTLEQPLPPLKTTINTTKSTATFPLRSQSLPVRISAFATTTTPVTTTRRSSSVLGSGKEWGTVTRALQQQQHLVHYQRHIPSLRGSNEHYKMYPHLQKKAGTLGSVKGSPSTTTAATPPTPPTSLTAETTTQPQSIKYWVVTSPLSQSPASPTIVDSSVVATSSSERKGRGLPRETAAAVEEEVSVCSSIPSYLPLRIVNGKVILPHLSPTRFSPYRKVATTVKCPNDGHHGDAVGENDECGGGLSSSPIHNNTRRTSPTAVRDINASYYGGLLSPMSEATLFPTSPQHSPPQHQNQLSSPPSTATGHAVNVDVSVVTISDDEEVDDGGVMTTTTTYSRLYEQQASDYDAAPTLAMTMRPPAHPSTLTAVASSSHNPTSAHEDYYHSPPPLSNSHRILDDEFVMFC